MSFTVEQIERIRPLWNRMLSHRFLLETRDGTIADETFASWMRQDYLFVEAALPFIAGLLTRAPAEHREPLIGFLPALQDELELFRREAAAAGVELEGASPSLTCHAYVQFLLATVHRASYAEAFAVLYAAEKAYHESWKVVRDGLDEDARWWPFVDNWSSEEFGEWVAWIGGTVDALAEGAGRAGRARMADLFERTVQYEIAFWEAAVSGETWPGLEGSSGEAA